MSKKIKFKILTVIGARPQFIKSATISRLLIKKKYNNVEEVIVHTGQHYDDYLSGVFFRELEIPDPKYNLNVGSGNHSYQTGLMMSELEKVFEKENPNLVLVYGDTNSTLSGALIAAKSQCKLAHVEAGLRSYRKGMPEEVNRLVADSLSDILFCPTKAALTNLNKEGRGEDALLVGDVMYDSFLYHLKKENIEIKNLQKNKYILSTIHRAENTDNEAILLNIFSSLRAISNDICIIMPLHPRTKKMVQKLGISLAGIEVIEPVSYKVMLQYLKNASLVITDSGGLQKEAYFAKVPCITLRDETEWVETLENGWNRLVAPNAKDSITALAQSLLEEDFASFEYSKYYGDGNAAQKIIDRILEEI